MVACVGYFLRIWPLVSVLLLVACASGTAPDGSGGSNSNSSGSGGTGGLDAGHFGPCGVDCSKLQAPQCMVSVCNTGQALGALNTCVAVPVTDGSPCDDGKFCTTGDVCTSGTCVGGAPNDCGLAPAPCSSVTCSESSKSCSVTSLADGTACTPTDRCQMNGVCQSNDCVGTPKDCSFSPLSECNNVTCDPATGTCKAAPDSSQDGTPCVLTGDLCSVDKACMSGQCVGGTPRDCSALDVACQVGVCDGTTGLCGPTPAQVGAACSQGIQACQVGACDAKGGCTASAAPDGTACNDHDACTSADTCTAGVCAGAAVPGCAPYFLEGFETCPDGWTLGGDWQCGAPTNPSGPPEAHNGHNCISTGLAGDYSNNDSYDTCVANSPSIDLTSATKPAALLLGVGLHRERLRRVEPEDQHRRRADLSPSSWPRPRPTRRRSTASPRGAATSRRQGWQNYTADLTAYAGQKINLQFGFRSDPATVFAGVYIDDLTVAEPVQIPLYITTSSPLANTHVEQAYAVTITKIGGTSGSVWSLDPGGTNAGWLTIDPTSGVLSGRATAANVGPVSVTVHVEEPTLPSNFAEQTYTFEVEPNLYYTSFEGPCPDGWTLTGDWQCGVPTNPSGPATAYVGTQCIGTGMVTDYSNDDTWAGTTATSPPIALPGVQTQTLTFRMWVDTEGASLRRRQPGDQHRRRDDLLGPRPPSRRYTR